MDYKTDYHIHSTYSDGTKSVAEIIKKYRDEGYDEIALTDHDGIDGVKEAMALGKDYKIQVISGIEFATTFEGKELHLLGYKFDVDNPELNALCEQLRENRHARNVRLIEKLNEMGYVMTIEELESQSLGKYVGKPNIARLLIEKGYASDKNEIFESKEFFQHPEILAIRKEKPDTADAIKIILGAGGIPVLAHPMKIKKLGDKGSEEFWSNLDSLVITLKKEGLKGLEVWYNEHTDPEVQKLGAMAAKYHLYMTTGSDYHGEDVKINYISL